MDKIYSLSLCENFVGIMSKFVKIHKYNIGKDKLII